MSHLGCNNANSCHLYIKLRILLRPNSVYNQISDPDFAPNIYSTQFAKLKETRKLKFFLSNFPIQLSPDVVIKKFLNFNLLQVKAEMLCSITKFGIGYKAVFLH